ncbi:MAG: hypothetical protein QG565_1455, partial [Campylobacterota bacterium]|nr:hypothetical protein [Campylobacterota bacterium]
ASLAAMALKLDTFVSDCFINLLALLSTEFSCNILFGKSLSRRYKELFGSA